MAKAYFWFRRDLRIEDNAGLYKALKSGNEVQCIFIFDKNILDHLPKEDKRVVFLHETISKLNASLRQHGSSLQVYYGKPKDIWKEKLAKEDIAALYSNRDYESYAIDRDGAVKDMCEDANVEFLQYKDHVIFDQSEVVKGDGDAYTVFTPYSRKWKEKLDSKGVGKDSYYLKPYPTMKYISALCKSQPMAIPTLEEMGFEPLDAQFPPQQVDSSLIRSYDRNRNFPAVDGTSRLGLHFRFGTISIREKCRKALGLNQTYVNELIWRDFYSMILEHYPYVEDRSFRPQYDEIAWRNDETDFEKWKNGTTGYPIVDAGMRELNETGYMHNRVRMITASFLTKHLLIDWRWGAAYFAEKLLDYDLASNNGGWQWAAGSGTDAAPYFRIFNPSSQQEKFDKNLTYIKKWVPEYGTNKYPSPMVDHKVARERCLETYKKALKGA